MTENDIINALETWCRTMETQNIENVTALYADDAGFWGTIASTLSTNPNGVTAYMQSFLGDKSNIQITVDHAHTQSFDSLGLISGQYTFNFDANGTRHSVPARFSFAFQKDANGTIKIAQHHSSFIPESTS